MINLCAGAADFYVDAGAEADGVDADAVQDAFGDVERQCGNNFLHT